MVPRLRSVTVVYGSIPSLAAIDCIMKDFVVFAERSIPFDILLPSVGMMCVVILLIFAARLRRRRQWVAGALLGEYLFLVLWSTVIRRIGSECVGLKLMPYWNLDELLSSKDPLDFVEIGLNIVLFVPIGLLLASICKQWKVWKIALIGCGMSMTIEALQLAFRCGLCETNDVIHNTIGCLIGVWMQKEMFWYKLKNDSNDNSRFESKR